MRSTAAPLMSLSLLTDLYQLTMSYGYYKQGRVNDEAVFHLYFRRHPFQGGYTVCAGLESALEYLEGFSFDAEDIAYLASLKNRDGSQMFEQGFLDYLAEMKLSCDVAAIPEGTVVFPQEPLLRVTGPLIQAQLLETALLNLINFQTLVATKAARVVRSAKGDPVLEFGLRRAQGIDGGVSASRAAYIGGCAATSNVLAGQRHGIPVQGTHAHSWVMSYDTELESFLAYAEAMPGNCVFLVDTYDTLTGVKTAIEVGLELKKRGHELLGVRLDSGDLAWLSIEARRLLDEAGFTEAAIVASNDLDEHLIRSIKNQGAQITMWGVGTKLATAYDQPALGGVYKMAAIRGGPEEPWRRTLKLSEQASKISNPGILSVRRYRRNGQFECDLIYCADHGVPDKPRLVDPNDGTRRRKVKNTDKHEELLVPVLKDGVRCYDGPGLDEIRARTQAQLGRFYKGCLRLENPHEFPVGLEEGLYEEKTRLIIENRAVG